MAINVLNEELRQGLVERNVLTESKKLVQKWSKTGLLDGNLSEMRKANLARLMENQAQWILKESSSQADIIGFQNVAFPMIRRVFGGLIANELVGVQPMSLPSGLIFYMDYRYDTVKAGNMADDFAAGASVFGVRDNLQSQRGEGAMYNLGGTSFSQRERVSTATFSGSWSTPNLGDIDHDPDLSGSFGALRKLTLPSAYSILQGSGSLYGTADLKQWMPLSGTSTSFTSTNDGTPVAIGVTATDTVKVYRRFTKVSGNDLVFIVSGSAATLGNLAGNTALKVSYLVAASLTGGTSGTMVLDPYESDMAASPTPNIPELDFRIQSEAVTAQPRKLKAKWTPELAQDLAAYQNLDAEVELTTLMSEQIALEIDREILADILYNATGARMYWSRKPGNFVDKNTGGALTGASFTGNVKDWYDTLIERCIDVGNAIHNKTLRGTANFLVCNPTVCTILEFTLAFKANMGMDPKESTFAVGAEKAGTLSNKYTVYKDPYFPKTKILIGYKGSGYLEVGYVYAPYVPLIVTPTIYAPEDGTPRKMMMTRYAKKMVRSDFYGTLTVLDL
ncbi:MAG: hypothetical protein WC763_07000 [Candidatus Paceibacterota bacterium]|jgi:hypothetical protein